MFLFRKILEFWAARSRIEVISGHGATTPYLIRYHLINNRFFKLYMHYFLRSDLDDPHDHPWKWASFMIQGAYTEEVYDWRTRSFTKLRRSPSLNRFVVRGAKDLHRVTVDRDLSLEPESVWRKEAACTLFTTLNKTQEWGFVENYETGPRWKHWAAYLAEKDEK